MQSDSLHKTRTWSNTQRHSYFNFIYDDDFLFASETKIHLTLYES